MLASNLESKLRKNIVISWSGGKDACLAMHEIKMNPNYIVKGLLTNLYPISGKYYVGMHMIEEDLICQQADSLELKLYKNYLSESEDNHLAMKQTIEKLA